MKNKPKLLFWLDGFLLHFCLSYYLQSSLDAELFGLIDINSNPKKFFKNQIFVNYKKTWFFHDFIKKNNKKPDLEYLSNFETKYDINLWKLALNERLFYIHNRFYKFSKLEILSILEQELKLFESILDEVKPDFFLTYDPVFHHQKLLLELCRKKGIRVLCIVLATGIENKTIIVEDGATYDLDPNSLNHSLINKKSIGEQNPNAYEGIMKKYIKNRTITLSDKFSAFREFLFDFKTNDIKSNFMYYGRDKIKVIKDALYLERRKITNLNFLNKVSTLDPNLDNSYIYFPMSVDEEQNLLHYAPYYTDQIEVIRHIAKSIPIDFTLFVKEHIAAGTKGWHDVEYYKQITEIPNVVFVNPKFDHKTLLKNSQLLMTIRGSSSLQSLTYHKPAIIFGEQPISIMPCTFTVDSLNDLPELIKKALSCKVDSLDYEKFVGLLHDRLFEFNIFEYEINRNNTFFTGNLLSNTKIKNNDMQVFLEENKESLRQLVNAHSKIISLDKPHLI